MIKTIYESITKALRLVRDRSQLKFILLLLVVFPLVFIFMLQQFLSVAKIQIESALKQSVSHDHENIVSLLNSEIEIEKISELMNSYVDSDNLVTVVKIAREEGEEIVVVSSTDPDSVGVKIKDKSIYKSAIAHTGNSVIYPFFRNGDRVWLTYRAVIIDGKQWYVHSEINLVAIDNQLERQVHNAYSVLAIVFIFLGVLVWWFWHQYDYRRAWQLSETKLQEQFSFSNMMVHELRAPLTAIKGYASMISEANILPVEHKQYIDRVSESSVRLIRLISDFLEVSRIQSGTLTVTLEEQDIRKTINTVVEDMIAVAEVKKLKLTCTMPDNPVIVATDLIRLHQIVTNLLSNAIKYTDQGSINVIVNKNPREVEIRIQDSGNGISAKDQTQLFKPFVRVGNADEGTEIGSGLGMWITKQLAVLLNGDIDIESIEKVGTHAVVHLYYKK